MSKLDNRSASLRFYDEDKPDSQFIKQITKHSRNNDSQGSAVCFKVGSAKPAAIATASNIKYTKRSTFQNIVKLPLLISKTPHSEFTSSVTPTEGCRADYFGNKIVKSGKKHKIVFSDHTGKGDLIDVINIINIKSMLSSDKSKTKGGSKKFSQNLEKDNEDNCSCLCSIF